MTPYIFIYSITQFGLRSCARLGSQSVMETERVIENNINFYIKKKQQTNCFINDLDQ